MAAKLRKYWKNPKFVFAADHFRHSQFTYVRLIWGFISVGESLHDYERDQIEQHHSNIYIIRCLGTASMPFAFARM